MAPIDRAKPLDALLAFYAARWEAFYGRRYLPLPGEKRLLGAFLSGLRHLPTPEERWAIIDAIPGAMERYLRDRTEGTLRTSSSHSLRYLVSCAMNKYLAEPRESLQERRQREQREHERRRAEERGTRGVMVAALADILGSESDSEC